jgi:pilus assembly protein Flp/PilA
MKPFIASIRKFATQEDGATMVEYALMVALIAIVCLLAVTAFGVSVNGLFKVW